MKYEITNRHSLRWHRLRAFCSLTFFASAPRGGRTMAVAFLCFDFIGENNDNFAYSSLHCRHLFWAYRSMKILIDASIIWSQAARGENTFMLFNVHISMLHKCSARKSQKIKCIIKHDPDWLYYQIISICAMKIFIAICDQYVRISMGLSHDAWY